jgi:hypothetical protein
VACEAQLVALANSKQRSDGRYRCGLLRSEADRAPTIFVIAE